MCCKSMRYPREALMALVPRDSVSWLMYGGSKVLSLSKLIKTEPKDKLVKRFGKKLYDRAFELNQRLETNRAVVLFKSPVELGLVELQPWSFNTPKGLTDKGRLELSFGSRFGLTEGFLLKHATEKIVPVQKLRVNPRPTFGNQLFGAVMTARGEALKSFPHMEASAMIQAAVRLLEARVEPSELRDDIDELRDWAIKNYPIKDGFKEALMDAYQALESRVMDHAADEDEESPEVTLESLESKDQRQIRTDIIGSHSVSQDPNDRKLAFIAELEDADRRGATAEEAWNIISRILDHYSGSDFSAEFVYLGPRSDEARVERDEFPYDPNCLYEPVFKVDTGLRDPGESRDILIKAGILKPNQEKYISERKVPVCDRRGKQLVTVHNLEEDGDFELEHHFERVDDEREWRKRIGLLLKPANLAETLEKMTELKLRARFINKYPDKEDKSFNWFRSRGLLGEVAVSPAPILVGTADLTGA